MQRGHVVSSSARQTDLRAARLVSVVVLIASLFFALAIRDASAISNKVLILDTTVSGGASSAEAQAAVALGLGVDVVNATQWAAMTTAQFADYRAIILGDATCGGSIAAAEANTAVWGPAVTGNVIINGTDPVFHYGQGGQGLVDKGIAYAVASASKTGAYISLSCYYGDAAPGTPVLSLDAFSPGGFSVTSVGCFNDAYIVATHPALDGLTDATLSDWSCSVHEAFDKWPASFEVLAIARNAGSAYTATDGTVGTPYILARGEGLVVVSDISLSPASAINPLGTSHTLTATVAENGTPIVGTTVTFSILSGPHTGLTGSGQTDANGEATFTYTGTIAGTDTIRATFVDSTGTTQTSNAATKTWEASAVDTMVPSCVLTSTGKNAQGKTYIQVTAQDTGSGIASIVVTKSNNAATVVPPFTAGTTDPLVVVATKILQNKSSQVELRVTDVAGNVTTCDPILTVLVKDSKKPATETFTNVPTVEGVVTITNGSPGVKTLIMIVNGTRFKEKKLKNGEIVTVDISSAMQPGDANTITLIARGQKGSSVEVMIWDGVQ